MYNKRFLLYTSYTILISVTSLMLAGCTTDTHVDQNDDATSILWSTGWEKWSDDVLVRNLGAEELSLDELKALYQKYKLADDIAWEINIIRHLYELKPNQTLQNLLIDKYLEVYRYDEAFDLVKNVLDTTALDSHLIDQYLFILFNSRQLNLDNLSKITELIGTLHQSKKINDDQLNMYYALLDIAGLNTTKFEAHITALSDSGVYQDIKKDSLTMLKLYRSYKDAPKYYLSALLSKVFFQHSYLKLADLLAQHALSHKSEYILPLQTLAYSSFLQQHYNKSTEYLNTLITIDPKHDTLYKILLAIAYYENKSYSDTILYVSQIREWAYYPLALRYLLLSYRHLWQDAKIVEVLQQLLWSNTLNEYDYYYIFDEVFYKGNKKLYDLNPILIAQYVDKCNEMVGWSDPVCMYGRAGIYRMKWNDAKAHPLLLKVSRYFPHAKVFVLIAQHYETEGDSIKAKSYYLKAVAQSDSENQKKYIKNLIDALDT